MDASKLSDAEILAILTKPFEKEIKTYAEPLNNTNYLTEKPVYCKNLADFYFLDPVFFFWKVGFFGIDFNADQQAVINAVSRGQISASRLQEILKDYKKYD